MGSLFDNRATLYEDSKLSLRTELSSFSLPNTDISCLYSTDYLHVKSSLPVREINNELEFLILVDNSSFVDLSESYLHLTCRITKGNGTDCDSNDFAAPSNLFFHLMFKNLEIYINGKCISGSQNQYPYIAYINRLLSLPTSVKEAQLQNELWYPNTTVESYEATSVGYKERYDLAKNSQKFTMLGQIVSGLFLQKRWLGPGTEIRIVLRRNTPHFCIDNKITETGADGSKVKLNYRFEIDDAVFLVSRKPVSAKIMELHRSLLNKNETYIFVMPEAVVRTMYVPAGMTSISSENLLIGQIPKLIILGMVKSTAVGGVLTESPVNFQHFNLSNVTISWNADTLESRSIPLNFKSTTNTNPDDFLLGLHSLQKCLADPLHQNGINRSNYTKGLYSI